MARTYTNPSTFDDEERQFTVDATSDGFFLKFGALDDDDLRYMRSLIQNGYIGYFQNAREVDFSEILSTFSTENGIEIDSTPDLIFNADYEILITQARPGTARTIYPYSSELQDGIEGVAFTFTWRDTDHTGVITEESVTEITEIVDWEQGNPVIPDFQRSDIALHFYSTRQSNTPIRENDADWLLGIDDSDSDPQPLSAIVRLGDFTDNGDNTGTIEVIFNTNQLDIMMQKNIYFELSVEQPTSE